MKIEKVLFFLPPAMDYAATKLRVKPPALTDLVILYILRRSSMTCFAIHKLTLSYGRNTAYRTIHYSLQYLLSIQFIERTGKAYTIAPLGREYLSLIRRYLLNKRL